MKKYIYKVSIVFFFIYLLYELTIGKELRFFKKEILSNFQSFVAEDYKIQLKLNIENLLKKDKIFYDDDAKLISLFLKKIMKELDLLNK